MKLLEEDSKGMSYLTIDRYKDPNPAWRRILHYAFFFVLGALAHWVWSL